MDIVLLYNFVKNIRDKQKLESIARAIYLLSQGGGRDREAMEIILTAFPEVREDRWTAAHG